MLLHDQYQPLPLRDLFKNAEVVPIDDFADILILVAQNSGQNCNAVQPEDAVKFGKEISDDVGGQVPQKQIHTIALHGVQRPAKRVDIPFCIAVDVRAGNVGCYRIDVTSKNRLCSQQARCDRQNSRTGPDIEDSVARFDPSFQSLHGELSRFMGSCAESLARLYADRQTVIRACGVCPTWNDEKAIGNREAGIGLLPLLRPVAFFNNSTRHGWSLSLDPFKDGSNNGFNSVEIRTVSEVENEPG